MVNFKSRFRWGHFVAACLDCGVEVHSKNGHRLRCGPCAEAAEKARHARPEHRERMAGWNRANRARMRARGHGLTAAEHEALYLKQRGRCAICRRRGLLTGERAQTGDVLVIDHWHGHGCERAVGAGNVRHCAVCIRGLLCANCNAALGMLKDDPDLARRVVRYLEVRGQLSFDMAPPPS